MIEEETLLEVDISISLVVGLTNPKIMKMKYNRRSRVDDYGRSWSY